MSRKDYIGIAKIIRNIEDEEAKRRLIAELSVFFLEDNRRFNAKKFEDACK